MLIISAMSTQRPLESYLLVFLKGLHIQEKENETLIISKPAIGDTSGDLKSVNCGLTALGASLNENFKDHCWLSCPD